MIIRNSTRLTKRLEQLPNTLSKLIADALMKSAQEIRGLAIRSMGVLDGFISAVDVRIPHLLSVLIPIPIRGRWLPASRPECLTAFVHGRVLAWNMPVIWSLALALWERGLFCGPHIHFSRQG
jgi:hypothetical protein